MITGALVLLFWGTAGGAPTVITGLGRKHQGFIYGNPYL